MAKSLLEEYPSIQRLRTSKALMESRQKSGMNYDGEEDAWEHVWYYGNDVKICFHADDWNTVSHVIVTANNGFSTPVGVYVGMRESALGEIYGAPLKLQGEWYYYRSVSNLTTGVLIVVENGKIIRINIGDGFRLDG